jgi:hypothetical protein
MPAVQMVAVLTISGALLWGMSLALLGSLKLALARRVQLAEGPTGTLHALFNLMLVPVMLLAGLLVDRVGIVPLLITGSALLSVALFALTARQTPGRGFATLLLAGFGTAAVSTATLLLMPTALFGSGATSASLNLGLVFVALGALLTPPLTDLLLDRFGLRRCLALLALLALVPGFLATTVPHDQLPTRGEGTATALFTQGAFWLAALVFFLYAPLEAAVAARCAGLALPSSAPGPARAAGQPVAAGWFWLAFVASRLGLAGLQSRKVLGEEWDSWLVVLIGLLVAVLIGNLAGGPSRGRTRIGLMMLGLLLGPLVPTALALVFHHVAPGEPGTAYGALFAAGSLGSFVFAPLVRIQAGEQPLASFRLPLWISLALTGAMLVFTLVVGQ